MAYNSLSELFKGICDAIREKKGISNKTINHQDIPSEIRGITTGTDTSDATADESMVVNGKTFYASGEKKTGTMPLIGDNTFNASSNSLTVDTDKNTVYLQANNIEVRAYTGDVGGSLEFPILDSNSLGDAAVGDVTNGKTFTSKDGVRLTGTKEDPIVQDILQLASGTTKYTNSFQVNGETRNNVLTQPSDFSDESAITWSSSVGSYFSHSIENIDGSENGSALVLSPVSGTNTSVKNLFWIKSTVDASTSESRTYLVAIRLKADSAITSYYPELAATYRPTGGATSTMSYYSYIPTTEWQTFYFIVNIPENCYLYDVTMCFCNRGITYYIDWVAAYDITGTNFGHMTYGARATAFNSDVLTGKTFYKDGTICSGTMAKQTGWTVVPSTTQQLAVSSGKYTDGDIYVSGDSNLVSDNIKKDVSIFGVTGSYEGDSGKVYLSTTTATPTSTTELIVSGLPTDAYTFFLVGTGTLSLRTAVAFYYNSNNKALEAFIATGTSKTSALSSASSYFSATFSSGTLTINATKSYYTFSTGTTFNVYCLSGAPVYNIEIPIEVES